MYTQVKGEGIDTVLMTHGVRAKHADESRDGASQRLKPSDADDA